MDKNSNSGSNYYNPPPITIVAEIFRENNIQIIREYVIENNLDEKYIEILTREFLKINDCYPKIVQKKSKEKLQINIFK